ncbi:unnamed protein product, partial [Mesorhabditis belari]|uniref:Sex-determining protein fem-1 n=1 Tax=Mesorhabditis belari TaxID=2138241 RepID=A0AAF3J9P1_9BILA
MNRDDIVLKEETSLYATKVMEARALEPEETTTYVDEGSSTTIPTTPAPLPHLFSVKIPRLYACMSSPEQIRYLVYFAAEHGNLKKLEYFCEGIDSAALKEVLKTSLEDKSALVVAAREGHLDVVKFLVNLGADVLACGTVEFDGETIFGAPPIWAAAAAGFLDVVRYLVEEAGADLNQTTRTNSTPLRGACYDGHLEIVKYLVEHGADIECANRHGHTPLMIAAYRQKQEVVEYLLAKGANPREASRKGNTALHDAVEANNVSICEVLLEAGAILAEDEYGVCPLMSAAMLGFTEVVELLLNQPISLRKKRDVLKIMGATFVDRRNDYQGGIEYWFRALSLDLGEENAEEVEAAELRSKDVPKIYGSCELETLDDFNNFVDERDPHTIRMQALVMRERILGGSHPEVHYYLKYRGALYSDIGMNGRCFSLWMHALELQQKYNSPLHQQTMQTFLSFQETFAMILTEPIVDNFPNPPLLVTREQVETVFDKAAHELQKLVDWGSRPLFEECNGEDHEHNIDEEKENLILLLLRLLYLSSLAELSPRDLQNIIEHQPYDKTLTSLVDLARPRVDLKRFLSLSREVNLRPLHVACGNSEPIPNIIGSFPNMYVVESLVRAGAPLDEMDEQGQTPLHCLLASDEHSIVTAPFVRYLLKEGAPIHARNANDETCLELIVKKTSRISKIGIASHSTLFGAAANAIRRAKMPYEALIPTHLLEMMKLY